MDILSEILKQVLEGAAQQQAPAPQQRAPQPQQQQRRAPQGGPQSGPQSGPQGMPSPTDLSEIFTQIFGGGSAQKLPDVVKQFEEKGLRDEVDSWVRTGPNKPVNRRQSRMPSAISRSTKWPVVAISTATSWLRCLAVTSLKLSTS